MRKAGPGRPGSGHPDVAAVPARRFRWQSTFRLVPSRFPPIQLFERIAPPEDWEKLIALEGFTNPRLRQEAGAISLVPPGRRVSGPNASVVMAPFTHVSPARPTRFSDGSYGVYYAAQRFETALREVAFHMGRFHAATGDPALTATYRVYKGRLDAVLHDLTRGDWPGLLDPDVATYAGPQALARRLRQDGSDGLVYPSVRHRGGACLAAFWPDVVPLPVQANHVELKWDGTRIAAWLDHGEGRWQPLPT